jgi:hypothetical protein
MDQCPALMQPRPDMHVDKREFPHRNTLEQA